MWNSLRFMVVLGALGAGAFACTAGSGPVGLETGTSAAPVRQAEVTLPGSGVKITATNCVSATPPSTKAADGGGASGIAPSDGCGSPSSYCQGSNVQIAFNATAGSQSATVEIVSVTLLDASTGKLVDTLHASKPQSWNGNAYTTWDQSIAAAGELKASYDLTSPAWSTLSGSDTSRTAYSTAYTLNVTLRIDGVEVTLESASVNREPPVST
jgi:hypothetical protein